jgi:hypothetical protein
MADDMKKNGGFIPGVKPGKRTAEFLDDAMSKITLPGSLFLALVAILPAFAMLFNVSQGFAQFYGGTSLLIMVGVVLDTLQQIESHLLMRHYDGLTSTGRIKGAPRRVIKAVRPKKFCLESARATGMATQTLRNAETNACQSVNRIADISAGNKGPNP